MIDRNDIELRIAEHEERVALVNRTGWQRHGAVPARRPRRALAAVLRALATRLDPAQSPVPPFPPARRV
jgi:hypothetical protein